MEHESAPDPGGSGGPASGLEVATEWATTAYAVKVPTFEGPLDLLLHLIRINEVEITDIPVARISEQYLNYLEVMRDLNLDVAGDYLVMAATLAWIKSRMLLPPDPSGEDSEELDPRAELAARLLEYQRFKEVSESLGEREWLGRDVFAAVGPELERVPDAEREVEAGLFELIEAYRAVLAKARPSGKSHSIEAEPVTVRERMLAVMDSLRDREAADFEEILMGAGGMPHVTVVIASFLAVLELTRLEVLRVYQGVTEDFVPEGPIHLRRACEPGDEAWMERIADIM